MYHLEAYAAFMAFLSKMDSIFMFLPVASNAESLHAPQYFR